MCNHCLLGRSDTFCRLFFSIFRFHIPALCVLDLQFYIISLEFGILVSGTKHKLTRTFKWYI